VVSDDVYMLAGAARQPVFSVILSQSIYLSTFVCRFTLLQSARQPPDTWRSVSNK